MITNIKQLDLSQKYTYADYLTWQFNEMVELIQGKIFEMSPAPNLYHQRVSGRLYGLIFQYLKDKNCEAFHAPFDVRLPLPPHLINDESIDTVVQPDVSIICDPHKLDIKGCIGAPDWIIEILSPATAQKDLREKYDLYEFAGVKEYWVIHPHEQTLLVFKLNDKGKYEGNLRPFVREDIVTLSVFDDFSIHLEEVFPEVQS